MKYYTKEKGRRLERQSIRQSHRDSAADSPNSPTKLKSATSASNSLYLDELCYNTINYEKFNEFIPKIAGVCGVKREEARPRRLLEEN
jgi:hypothetical protein